MRTIDADVLKEALCDKGIKGYEEYNQGLATALDLIDLAPTVDTTCPNCDSGYAQGYSDGYLQGREERPQGEWIRKGDSKWHCSKCGAVPEFDGTTNTDKFNVTMSNKYCRLCGADMRKGGADMRKGGADMRKGGAE